MRSQARAWERVHPQASLIRPQLVVKIRPPQFLAGRRRFRAAAFIADVKVRDVVRLNDIVRPDIGRGGRCSTSAARPHLAGDHAAGGIPRRQGCHYGLNGDDDETHAIGEGAGDSAVSPCCQRVRCRSVGRFEVEARKLRSTWPRAEVLPVMMRWTLSRWCSCPARVFLANPDPVVSSMSTVTIVADAASADRGTSRTRWDRVDPKEV